MNSEISAMQAAKRPFKDYAARHFSFYSSEDGRVVRQRNAGNLQVHGADANTLFAQDLQPAQRLLIPRQDVPLPDEFRAALHPSIDADFVCGIFARTKDGNPAAHHLFHGDDRNE